MTKTNVDLDALEEQLSYYDETGIDKVDFEALPALIAELRDLRARTTPEVIGERHKDGNWWLVWEPCRAGWICSCYDFGEWWERPGKILTTAPTHALPLPEAPDA